MIELICKQCGKKFKRNPSVLKKKGAGQFCSLECRKKFYHVILTCEFCKKPFEVRKVFAHKRRFCSNDCRAKSDIKLVEKTCKQCGNKFKINPAALKYSGYGQYCSKACYSKAHYVKLICEQCGKQFETRKSRVENGQKCCSNECKKKLNKVTLICECCGKHFVTPKYREKQGQKLCSKECRANIDRVNLICAGCGKPFVTIKYRAEHGQTFCTNECRTKEYNSELKCVNCGKVFIVIKSLITKRKFCSKICREDYYNKTITNEERERGRSINGSELKKWRKDVLKRDGRKCVICGSNKYLRAHHKNAWKKYKEQRYVVENGVICCVHCHNYFHKLYGKGDNTKEQWIDYINKINIGVIILPVPDEKVLCC